MSLLQNIKITRVAAASAAAMTDVVGSVIDMAGFGGVLFVALTGDVTATSALALKAAETDNADGSSAVELVGSAAHTASDAAESDSKALVIDVRAPRKRYLRAVLERGVANAAIDGIIAIQYRPTFAPTAQDVSVIAKALLNDPDEVA